MKKALKRCVTALCTRKDNGKGKGKMHSIKTCRRNLSMTPLILHFSSRKKWVISFTPLPPYPRWNIPRSHWIGGSVCRKLLRNFGSYLSTCTLPCPRRRKYPSAWPRKPQTLKFNCYFCQQGQTVFQSQPVIFLVVRLHGDKIEKNEMGWACGANGWGEEVYRVLVGKPEGKRLLENLGVDWCIILRWISRRWDFGLWTGLGWRRIETGGGRLWVR